MTCCSFVCVIATRTTPDIAFPSWTIISRVAYSRAGVLGRHLRIGFPSIIRTVHSKTRPAGPLLIHQSAPSDTSAGHGKISDDNEPSLISHNEFGHKLTFTASLLSSENDPTAKLNFRSCISYSAIIYIGLSLATAIAIASRVSAQDDSSQIESNVESTLLEIMASDIPPGHHGNLTLEQENKLRKLWHEIFTVCGIHGGNVSATDTSRTDEKSVTEARTGGVKKKRGFGLFKSSQPDASTSGGLQSSDSIDDDKFGLTKEYQEIIASQKPEDIRESLWTMVRHDHPDALILRFLRARKWNVEQALVMLVSAMNWRHSRMKVDQDIMKNGEAGAAADEKSDDPEVKKLGGDFLKQIRAGKSFLHGTDKAGRPICVVRARLHKAGEESPESLERYTIYVIETARLALKPPLDLKPTDRWSQNIIFDMTGFTLANMDYHPVKFMIQCFEANYPESLGVVLVHNAPWVFQGIWRILRGWLDPVVASKVCFTNGRAGLEEFIKPEQIIKDLDGDEDWTYSYPEPIEGENDVMKDVATKNRLLEERQSLYAQFEDSTRKWINHPDGVRAQEIKVEREAIAAKLRDGYWRLDPFIRARSLYDRQGIILPNGNISWYQREDAKSGDTVTEKNSLTNGTSGAA
ncbi:hypothetical protein E4U43_008600 [Claviceps pusilla]|uniref:CRAL-TRIO domain-containing protein n=1 Tax=Claviceps pusilla TaxID=123648 RepID=A0A9P7NHB9_9HYPO|nr:hypothetical protein E4U43_008600 [Claviceps pusilla]